MAENKKDGIKVYVAMAQYISSDNMPTADCIGLFRNPEDAMESLEKAFIADKEAWAGIDPDDEGGEDEWERNECGDMAFELYIDDYNYVSYWVEESFLND